MSSDLNIGFERIPTPPPPPGVRWESREEVDGEVIMTGSFEGPAPKCKTYEVTVKYSSLVQDPDAFAAKIEEMFEHIQAQDLVPLKGHTVKADLKDFEREGLQIFNGKTPTPKDSLPPDSPLLQSITKIEKIFANVFLTPIAPKKKDGDDSDEELSISFEDTKYDRCYDPSEDDDWLQQADECLNTDQPSNITEISDTIEITEEERLRQEVREEFLKYEGGEARANEFFTILDNKIIENEEFGRILHLHQPATIENLNEDIQENRQLEASFLESILHTLQAKEDNKRQEGEFLDATIIDAYITSHCATEEISYLSASTLSLREGNLLIDQKTDENNWNRLSELGNKEFECLGIPVNIDNHWVLYMINKSNPENPTITRYDSWPEHTNGLNDENRPWFVNNFEQNLKAAFGIPEGTEVLQPEVTKQGDNTNNCGIHVCKNAEFIKEGKTNFTEEDPEFFTKARCDIAFGSLT